MHRMTTYCHNYNNNDKTAVHDKVFIRVIICLELLNVEIAEFSLRELNRALCGGETFNRPRREAPFLIKFVFNNLSKSK